jgi:CheY-like chemotaxis protein
VGRGSEFVVRVPAVDIAEAESTPSPRREERSASPARVLIVDDNEDAADMLEHVLSHIGYVVATAHDGPSALALARDFAPDVALLDIGLPVMDGYELAGQLRRLCAPSLVLMAVTGYGQPADRARSAVAGFDEHLVKPIDLDRLKDLLRTRVGERTTP